MNVRPEYYSLKKLLDNRLFRIPHYQRAYSWQSEHRAAMFDDIKKLKNQPADSFHFMATVVGLKTGSTEIATEPYDFIDIVDGQQRITTLVLLFKTIEQKLNCDIPDEKDQAQELKKLLVKQDDASLILLQTNHDGSRHFAKYLRSGKHSSPKVAQTLADYELLSAIEECESFVNNWENPVELLGILKNKLTFVYHEIENEAAVYTVFETLNDRGLDVSWLDKLKSRLMRKVFEDNQGNKDEHIDEIHKIWGKIYKTLGPLHKVASDIALRENISSEVLRFAATLEAGKAPSQPFGEKQSVNRLMKICQSTSEAIEVSNWLLDVTNACYKLLNDMKSSKKAVAKNVQARLLGVAIILRECSPEEKKELLEQREKTTFRIFSLCGTEARKEKGAYIQLAWKTLNDPEFNTDDTLTELKNLGANYDIEEALSDNKDCYTRWSEELRYLLYRYEEHLAEQRGVRLNNRQWQSIWDDSASNTIEHIFPQSSGSSMPLDPGQDDVFVHRLGNLMLLPPDDNSRAGGQEPKAKIDVYRGTSLLLAEEVADLIEKEDGWGIEQIQAREQRLMKWIFDTWGWSKSDSAK